MRAIWDLRQSTSQMGSCRVELQFLASSTVCMTLARASDNPALKQYYEELALKFAENAASQHDPDNIYRRTSRPPKRQRLHQSARTLISLRQFIRVPFRLVGKVRKPLGELVATRQDQPTSLQVQ